jgi:hypothetical protein
MKMVVFPHYRQGLAIRAKHQPISSGTVPTVLWILGGVVAVAAIQWDSNSTKELPVIYVSRVVFGVTQSVLTRGCANSRSSDSKFPCDNL